MGELVTLPRQADGWGLRFLYHTAPGRLLLRGLTGRGVSRLCGRFLDSPASKCLISGFRRQANIDLSQYEPAEYRCFNDFFTRKIRPELRPVDPAPEALVAPCDGLLSVYEIRRGLVLPVKQSRFSVGDLLGDRDLAARFEGGTCLVFRLCVEHYHRYCYFDSGVREEAVFLPGKLHTVRPIALEAGPVLAVNCRERTLLHTDHFGLAAQIEVGAMLVGRIVNHRGPGPFRRGQEKGMFQYGGSTVVLLLGPGAAELPREFWEATARREEIPVKMGQRIGRAN